MVAAWPTPSSAGIATGRTVAASTDLPAAGRQPDSQRQRPGHLLHIILTGGRTAATAAHPRCLPCPGFARLSDQELAEILSFVRTSWGAGAPAVSSGDAAHARHARPETTDNSRFDTRAWPISQTANASQLVRGMRLHMETRDLLPRHVGNQLNCASCHLNAGTVADGSPFVGVSAFLPQLCPRRRIISLEDRINGCFWRFDRWQAAASGLCHFMKAMVAYFDWMKGA